MINTPDTQQSSSSISTQLVISISTITFIVVVLGSAVIYSVIRQNLEDQFSQRVLNLAGLTALAQEGNLHSNLKVPGDEKTSAYLLISKQNIDIVNSDPIIGAIYTMRQDQKKNIYFVVFTGQNSLQEQGKIAPSLGQIYTNASPLLKQEFSTLNAPIIEINQRTDQWGNWLSAYAPFYRSDGTREGVVGIDVNTDALKSTQNNILVITVGIFLFLVALLAIAGWILSIRIVRPLTNLTQMAYSFSEHNFGQPIIVSENNEIGQLGQAINKMAEKTSTLFFQMENKLLEKTTKLEEQARELEYAHQQAEQWEKQLKTFAFVARAILSIQNLDNLLPRIVAVVSEQLSFYHVGIFLLDDAKEYAVLTAANSMGGQRMLERNHRLKVGEEGIVGYVAGTARPRIALDTDKDIVFLTNPDLPETHSEIALPLKIGLDIIGVLDIQSIQFSAFTNEDIEIFSVLADYISVAIQNARRFQDIQKTSIESDTLYRNYLQQEWKSFTNQQRTPGYFHNISGSKPINKKLESIEIKQAIQSGKPTIAQEKTQSKLSVPIKLRGQVIGVLHIQSGSSHLWEEDEIDIATAVADRVGLAVENARLLEDSQSRAARERTIGEITSKIGASINIRNVLQTAVEELGHILPGSDVIIQLKDTKEE